MKMMPHSGNDFRYSTLIDGTLEDLTPSVALFLGHVGVICEFIVGNKRTCKAFSIIRRVFYFFGMISAS